MAEKYVNYVNLSDGTDLLDLRRDTVTEDYLKDGITAHDATGKPIVGKMKSGETSIIESGQCGENVYWSLYDNGILYISGQGDMYDYSDGDSPFSYRSDIKNAVIEEGVTSIGRKAFDTCENLIKVSIPDSVTIIGDQSFRFCKNLTSVVIPNGVTTLIFYNFFYCTNLKSITLPKSITTIGNAFVSCPMLESVFYAGTKSEWDSINISGAGTDFLNATLYCEYNPNADTVDGWNVQIISDGSDPENITKPTLTFVYTVG